jgi:hypothetical protein
MFKDIVAENSCGTDYRASRIRSTGTLCKCTGSGIITDFSSFSAPILFHRIDSMMPALKNAISYKAQITGISQYR